MLNREEQEAYFAATGEDGVRSMMQAGQMMPLGNDRTAVPSLLDAWRWLDRKRSERDAAAAKKEANRDRWMKAGVLLSLAAAVLAALSWLLPLPVKP